MFFFLTPASEAGSWPKKYFATLKIKIAFTHTRYYFSHMSNHQKFERLTITLPPELLAWVKSQKKELEAADRRVTTSISAIIADAVSEMRALDLSEGLKESKKSAQKTPSKASKTQPDVGANIATLSEHLGSGPSTATTGNSRKTG